MVQKSVETLAPTKRGQVAPVKFLTMVTIQQIKYFVATVEQKSLTAAAKSLNVSVQAVSKGLFDFESHFKRSLFVRKPHGVEPTPICFVLYKRAKDALAAFSELELYEKGIDSPEGHQPETLRIILCTPPFATRRAVEARVAAFIKRTINVEAHVTVGYLESCIDAVATGKADAFTTLGTTSLIDFDTLRIGTVNSGALMMENNKAATKQQVSLTDFEGHPVALAPGFDFFSDTVLAEYTTRGTALLLAEAKPTALDTHRVLVREGGCFIVPAIPEFGEFFPGAVIRPFRPEDSVSVPINMVTMASRKSDAYLTLERSLREKLPSIRGVYPNR